MALDVNLFEEGVGWEGVAGGDIRPEQVTILGYTVVCLAPHLYLPPNQLRDTVAQVPTAAEPLGLPLRPVAWST